MGLLGEKVEKTVGGIDTSCTFANTHTATRPGTVALYNCQAASRFEPGTAYTSLLHTTCFAGVGSSKAFFLGGPFIVLILVSSPRISRRCRLNGEIGRWHLYSNFM